YELSWAVDLTCQSGTVATTKSCQHGLSHLQRRFIPPFEICACKGCFCCRFDGIRQISATRIEIVEYIPSFPRWVNCRTEEIFMRAFRIAFLLVLSISLPAAIGLAKHGAASGAYRVLKTVKVGGEG